MSRPLTTGALFLFGSVLGLSAVAEESLKLKPADRAAAETSSAPATSRVRRPSATPRTQIAPAQVSAKPGESADEAWDRYFAAQAKRADSSKDGSVLKQSEAAVREAVREQMASKDYPAVIAMIQSALRNAQAQPWMYEALSLAMRASNAPDEEIERALMSGVDLSDDLDGVMMIALYMSKAGLERPALRLYQQVAEADPTRAEAYVQGLACAKYLHDRDALMWAAKGVLSQAWPREHRSVESDALQQARGLLVELRKEGETKLADQYEAEVNRAMLRDCVVIVSWTGEADVDVRVEEPSGSVCSLDNPRSAGGGVLVGDSYAQGTVTAGGYKEGYICPEAFNGDYRVLVKRVWGKVTANKVTVDIYTKTKHLREQLALGEKPSLFSFAVSDGRRSEPLAEQQIAQVAKSQNKLARQVLAQQIASYDQSSAARAYAVQTGKAGGGIDPRLLAGGGRRGAVGFTIRPTILQEGLTDITRAVISADRRYVRVTPSPSITAIGQVTTFNVAGGATNNITNTVNGGQNNNNGFGGIGGAGGT